MFAEITSFFSLLWRS